MEKCPEAGQTCKEGHPEIDQGHGFGRLVRNKGIGDAGSTADFRML